MPNDLAFLFRYRDLSADTLPEHRKVIDANGACWWGWWKRPSEDGRMDVWDALEGASVERPVVIGLFDSGSGLVHAASVIAVVKPSIQLGQAESVRPPEGEEALIPAYYRESRHSRAWLKLERITDDPENGFFDSYSYRNAPPLPFHTDVQLASLKDKCISGPNELRAMDTTIWEIRPRTGSDRTGEFLAATAIKSEPLLSRPIQCQGEWILHLTDPHYAEGPFRGQHRWRLEDEPNQNTHGTLTDAVGRALESRRHVGAVVVTGDLTFSASPGEFKAAARGIRRLLDGVLSLSIDHLVVVPGNHDVRWTKSATYNDGDAVEVAADEATGPYRDFYRSLFRHEPDSYLAMARRFCMPSGVLIDIVGLNSSSLEQGKNFLAGMGRVQEPGFDAAAGLLGWANSGSALRVLALHHHLALTENLEAVSEFATGFGIAVDAARTLRKAARFGVQLALHGHKHRAFIWRNTVYELPEQANIERAPSSLSIIGGGSAGSTSTEAASNFFNLFRVRNGRLELEMYRSTNGGSFEVMAAYSADFNHVTGVPHLRDWSTVPGGIPHD